MTELDKFLVQFEELIIEAPDASFSGGGLQISNNKYSVHFIHDETTEDPRDTLLTLIRNRPELLKAALKARNFKQTVHALVHLTEWLQHRDYEVGISGEGFLRSARVFLFGWEQRLLNFFAR